VGGAVWLLFLVHDRMRLRYLVALLPFVPLVLLAGANLLAFQAYYGSLANDYNQTVRQMQLAIPVRDLLICYFPVIVLAAVSICREADSRWRMIKGVVVLTALAVVFNDKLGYNNHPYRFIPYTYPLWAMLAGDGFVRLLRVWRQPFAMGMLCLTAVPLACGVWFNVRQHGEYAVAVNCKPVEPLVVALAAEIDKERRTSPGAVFFVEPSIVTADRLAPYSGARFFFSSDINYRSAYKLVKHYEEMLLIASMLGLRIDYVILPAEISGIPPLRVIAAGQQRFMMYKVVNYSLASS